MNLDQLHVKAHTWQRFPPTFPSLCTEMCGNMAETRWAAPREVKQLENHFFSSLTEGKNYFHLTCSDFTGQTVIASAADPWGSLSQGSWI